jgi:octaprenyl-diphosphate synthase
MFNIIQTELDTVFAKVEKEYYLKAGHLSKFIPQLELDEMDKYLRPALVILPAKLLKGCAAKMTVLAGVVQFIMVAQLIHNRIPDNCPKELPQFPVLVGDYLFSKFFKFLSDHDLLEWLAPLSRVICEMNEAGIMRKEVLDKGLGKEDDYLEVVRQEYGLLMAQACKIGGGVAKVHQGMQDALEQFGLNLGIGWGIIKENFPLSPIDFLEKARTSLRKLPAGPERDAMSAIVDRMIDIHESKIWLGQNQAAHI